MDLNSAQASTVDGPTRFAMHAVEGFGKTTMACHFPNPIVIGAERGIPRDLGFNVAVISPKTWIDVFDIVGSLIKDRHSYQTVIFDTVDWIEPLIHQFVLTRDSGRETEMNPKGRKLLSIEDYGYGKGYLVAEEEFRKLIVVLDELQAKRGMHIAMLMHSQVRTFKNPSGPDFDRYEPKCQQRIARVIVEWSENLLFGWFQVLSSKDPADVQRNEKSARAKGMGNGVRLVGARNTAMYDAKNRVGLPAEFELGESYAELMPILFGENVPTNAPRAELRAVQRDEGWADRQSREGGERARADAQREHEREERDAQGATHLDIKHRQNEERGVDPLTHAQNVAEYMARGGTPSAREEQNGPQQAPPRQLTDKERWDAERKAEPRSEPKTSLPPTDDKDKTRGAPTGDPNANGGKNSITLSRLTKAITEAGRLKGAAYRQQVEGWSSKAGGDVDKIGSIIRRVEKDLGVAIEA